MESDNKTFSVMKKGVGAFWVKEAGRIQNSIPEWDFPKMEAEKIAVIIPVTKEKLNDTTIDVFGTIRPYIAEAFYEAIDSACLFGTNAKLDLDISDVIAAVEKAGFDVDGFVAGLDFKNQLRKLRDADIFIRRSWSITPTKKFLKVTSFIKRKKITRANTIKPKITLKICN